MRLLRSNPLSLALAAGGASLLVACGDDGAEICTPRHETYHVNATLDMREPAKSAGDSTQAEAAFALAPGKLLVSVEQDRSILNCHDGLVTETHPASPLMTATLALRSAQFTLDVPSTVYPAIYVPMLWLQVRLDENDNGHCDDGELAGAVELPRAANASVQLELVRAACPLPTL